MFTLKSKKLLVLFVSCSLLLTACYPSGGELLSTEDNNVINEQINNIVSNNEHFDIEIDAPPAETISELPKINVKVMEWDDDKLKNIFLSEKENLEHQERYSEPFPNDTHHLYIEENAKGDKYWLGYEPGYLLSQDRQGRAFGYGTLGADLNFYRYEDIFTDDSISLLSKDETVKSCGDLLKELGITNYSEPTVYAVTVDKANKFWKEEQFDDSESLKGGGSSFKEWSSAEDEVYVMRFPIEYNDIAVTTDTKSHFVGSYIDFVVTKDEIYSLEGWNVFSPEYELGEKVKINCSAENALKIAAEHYDNLSIGGLNYKIFDCKLVYVPDVQHGDQYSEKNFTLVPMWEADAAYYRDDDTIGTRDRLFIDAESGKVIVW